MVSRTVIIGIIVVLILIVVIVGVGIAIWYFTSNGGNGGGNGGGNNNNLQTPINIQILQSSNPFAIGQSGGAYLRFNLGRFVLTNNLGQAVNFVGQSMGQNMYYIRALNFSNHQHYLGINASMQKFKGPGEAVSVLDYSNTNLPRDAWQFTSNGQNLYTVVNNNNLYLAIQGDPGNITPASVVSDQSNATNIQLIRV